MIVDKIKQDLKQAMRDKDQISLSVLRTINADFKNEAIELKKKDEPLKDEEALKVIKRQAKKHKDSIEQYQSAGRDDLVEQEKAELEIINKYLPEQMSEEKVQQIVDEVIKSMGEVTPSQFGEIMKKVMAQTKGQADGALVSKIVKEILNK